MFYSRIPSRICDEYTHTQAIVVWTGGRERLQTGFKLLCEGKGDSLFISGVHSQETLTSLLNLAEVSQVIACQKKESLKAHTYIGHFATNTRENALETKNWARLHNIKILAVCDRCFPYAPQPAGNKGGFAGGYSYSPFCFPQTIRKAGMGGKKQGRTFDLS